MVALGHERQVVVDDHVHLEDVDAACDDVRRDQHLLLALAEAVDDGVALLRVLGAVQRRDLVPLRCHPLRDAVGRVSMLNRQSAQIQVQRCSSSTDRRRPGSRSGSRR